ncbi:GNAT family N-acetyltransferase [Kutzneria sp. CA-103260]|uniref:GNAT family N-acetyltransferase n=1 Tax=Kutzneria sp. CA-103260 TaxID=2802641 RepID=UPI001BA5ED58|nr:GNAT family N-acetyltransferase [Kutzneria sp. CA-103260]QUQ70893.1 GNAT family N-acetyltransferase [Kutzneria sp. CA-103260]
MSAGTGVDATVVALTEQTWPALQELLGPQGGASGCWCMWFRRTANDFKRNKGEPNRQALGELVGSGEPVGLLALDAGGKAVGWAAVAPRLAHIRLDRSAVAAPPDPREDLSDVWSVTCFFVHRTARGTGITRSLLDAAVTYAAEHGARCIEGYPTTVSRGTPAPGLEGEHKQVSTLYHGTLTMFLDAGFELIGRRGIKRALVRRDLR